MPILRIANVGYRNKTCRLSIAAIFPPPKMYRTMPDGKSEDELTFHLAIVNNRKLPDEHYGYIQLSKRDLRKLHKFIGDYLETGITREIN